MSVLAKPKLQPPQIGEGWRLQPLNRLRKNGRIVNALTFDVEEYFQVQSLAARIESGQWHAWPSRVEQTMDWLLALLDETGVRATFFTLGWVAERHPGMVQRMVACGHELASHGYGHQRIDSLSPREFRQDVRRARAVLETICGVEVRGYRAPTFSIGPSTLWAFDILEEEGYAYSSSVYPVRHDLYGMPAAPRRPFFPLGADRIREFPISTVALGQRIVPCGGGGYFRLLPYAVYSRLLRRFEGQEGMPAIFYCHPWELDPEQPVVDGLSLRSSFRHYVNLGRMRQRLRRLLGDFYWDRLDVAFGLRQRWQPHAG